MGRERLELLVVVADIFCAVQMMLYKGLAFVPILRWPLLSNESMIFKVNDATVS